VTNAVTILQTSHYLLQKRSQKTQFSSVRTFIFRRYTVTCAVKSRPRRPNRTATFSVSVGIVRVSGLRHRTIGATSSNLSNHSVLHRHSSYPRCMLRSYAPSSHPFLVFPAILDLRLHSKHNRASLLFLRRIALQHDVAMFRSLHRRRCTPCILYSILFFFLSRRVVLFASESMRSHSARQTGRVRCDERSISVNFSVVVGVLSPSQ